MVIHYLKQWCDLVRLAWNRLISASLAVLGAAGVSAAWSDGAFSLSSPAFHDQKRIPGEYVFGEYGCTGANRSPPLEWHDVPSGTKSFAITLFDIDEHGSPSGWWHWVVYNLPATTMRLSVNAGAQRSHLLPPGGVQGRGDSARNAYDGPCPDRGEPAHRYVFTIYALSVDKLPVPDHASGAMVSWTARKYTLAKATLVGLYGR